MISTKPDYKIKWLYLQQSQQIQQFFDKKELIYGWYEFEMFPPLNYLYIGYTSIGISRFFSLKYQKSYHFVLKHICNPFAAEIHIWTKESDQINELHLIKKLKPKFNSAGICPKNKQQTFPEPTISDTFSNLTDYSDSNIIVDDLPKFISERKQQTPKQ